MTIREAFQPLADGQEEHDDVIDFRSGISALDLFPRKLWGQLAQRVCAEASDSVFGYDHPEGRPELRMVLARYLRKTRGIRCHPDQVVITSGATQAFSLVARVLLTPGDEVCIEDPTMYEVRLIFSSFGASLIPVPVDEHGMRTELLPAQKNPRFVFVTPSHQFPLGGILPIQRRVQLIQFARTSGSYLNALLTSFPEQVSLFGDATGLHLVAEFHGVTFTTHVLEMIEKAGVRVYPVEHHALSKGAHESKCILGYGNLTNEEIEQGIRRLQSVLFLVHSHKRL